MALRDAKSRDCLFSIILIIISIALYIINASYPKPSALFPKFILIILCLLALILLFKTIVTPTAPVAGKKENDPIVNKDILVIAFLTAAYIFLLIPLIGYYPSSFLYILSCYWYNRISKILMLLVPVCFCLLVFGFFQYSLDLVLP